MSNTNVFDIVHLKFLHKVNILNSEIEDIDPYRRRMRWEADMGEKAAGGLNMEIYVYGINSLRTHGDQEGRLKWSIAASVPSARAGTKFFLTLITSQDDRDAEFFHRQPASHTHIINTDFLVPIPIPQVLFPRVP